MKVFLLQVIIGLFFLGKAVAQKQKPDTLAFIRDNYKIYSMAAQNASSPELLDIKAAIPTATPINEQYIDSCLNSFKQNITIVFAKEDSNTIILGKPQPPEIKLTAPAPTNANFKNATFKINWNYIKNENNENILAPDIKNTSSYMVFNKTFYYEMWLNSKEGDSKPVKANGNIIITFPQSFKMLQLTSKDINKKFYLGNKTIKLLEIKGNIYKIEMNLDSIPMNILPVNNTSISFAINSLWNIPAAFYYGFIKKPNLTDADLAAILKTYNKNDKTVVMFGSVSGLIDKILFYIPDTMLTKRIDIDLEIKN